MAAERRSPRSFSALPLLCAALFLAGPLMAANVTVKKADDFKPDKIKRVAFLPFVRVEPARESSIAVCPVSDASFMVCRMGAAAEAELSRIVARALAASEAKVVWVRPSRIAEAKKEIEKQQGDEELDLHGEWQKAIAEEVRAGAALYGFIYCYRDRSGSAYASAKGAAIGFCLHLVRLEDNKTLWTFRYRDEQAPLTENLLELPKFIKRGGKFITIEQMAKEASAKLAESLPFKGPGKSRDKEK